MAITYEQAIKALRAADAAGNVDDARRLAQIASKLKSAPSAPEAPYNPAADMSGIDKFLAGTGKAFVDLWRGTEQLARGLVPGVSEREKQLNQEIENSKQRDSGLMKTGAGIAGSMLGGAAIAGLTALIPGVNTYTGAALTGSALAALQPVAQNESRTANAVLGGALGMAGKGAGDLLGRALRPVNPSLGPQDEILAAAARKEGIPLTAGQATGSRPLQVTESVMENLPLTSGPQLAQKEAAQRAFTAAALRRAGMDATEATAEGLGAQKSILGKGMEEITKRNALNFSGGLMDDLAALTDDAAKHLPPDSAAKIAGTVDQILSQVDETGKMAGTNYQGWREPLRNLGKKGDETASYFSKIRSAMDNAFRDQLEGSDGELFRETSRKYANLKTIMDAMGGAGKLPAKGQLSPAQLGASLGKTFGREGKALGRGDLNELYRIGQSFVSEQIPNSGTAQRQLVQALLTSGGGSLVGGAGAAASGGDPISGAMIGGGLTAGSLVAPRIVQALMNSQAGQSYLTKGAVTMTPEVRKAIAQALRIGAASAVPALTQ